MAGRAFDRMLLRDVVTRLDTMLPAQHVGDLGLDAQLPIALLPVRLEAKFSTPSPAPDRVLRVRIIPDDIHIPTLDPGITAREAALAEAYRTAADDAARDAAWQALLAGTGGSLPRLRRAAWLVALTDAGPVTARDGAPRTVRGLPDRWFVSAYSGDALIAAVTSADVAPGLIVDPASAAEDAQWLLDFDRARDVGMAVELPIGAAAVDVLLAVGVRGDDGAPLLSDLLEDQRFSRGVDLLPPGTATNNTAASRAFWRSVPDAAELRRQQTDPPAGAQEGSDGRLLSTALGLPPATPALVRPRAAGRTDQADAAAMIDLLWPITGGELLQVLMADLAEGPAVPQQIVETARDHASRFVRGRGPLPSLLVGRQPYGVLPAMSLARWVPDSGPFMAGMRSRMLTGWALWEAEVGTLTRVRDAGDATRRIAELLSVSPVPDPSGYQATTVFPPLYSLSIPFVPTAGPLDGDLAAGMLGTPWAPVLSGVREDLGRIGAVVLPAVDPAGGASLLQLRPADAGFRRVPTPQDAAPDLLSQLAQRSILRGAERTAAYFAAQVAGSFHKPELAEPVRGALFNDLDRVGAVSPLSFTMGAVFPDVAASAAHLTLAELVHDPSLVRSAFPGIDVAIPRRSPEYAAAIAALELLSERDAPTLELLLGETVDLFSNRFDAWATSFATRRLHDLRTARAEGVHLGAFGWLVDLRDAEVPQPGADWVHAPSVPQAATSAVLRNADIEDRAASLDPSGGARRFDLTSASVRIGRGILEAVGEGQPLAAVLGYRIERFLQDDGMIPDIAVLRKAFGTFAGEQPDPSLPAESIPAHDVVDGVAVWRALTSGAAVAGLDGDTRTALTAHVTALVDALSDLVVAEGVHELIAGDRARAGATITALSRGVPPPDRLRVVDTPGRRMAVPVQLLMVTDPDAGPGQGWADDRPRARIAPAAERIARALLPDPSAVGLRVERAEGGTETVALADMGLCALDLLAEAGADDDRSPLAARVRLRLGVPDARIAPQPPEGIRFGWGAVVSLARAWARVFGAARPLLPGDVVIGPGEGDEADDSTLQEAAAASTAVTRKVVQTVIDELVAAAGALRTALDASTPGADFSATAALEVFHAAGLAGTAQESDDDVIGLARRCIAAADAAKARWAQLDATPEPDHPLIAGRPGAGDATEQAERITAAVR
ncbi:MAG: hypothetical protein JST25_01875, partial [Actinobacteria bacterium]|nr:hypothetical protein [Actinomycetota bacterium]